MPESQMECDDLSLTKITDSWMADVRLDFSMTCFSESSGFVNPDKPLRRSAQTVQVGPCPPNGIGRQVESLGKLRLMLKIRHFAKVAEATPLPIPIMIYLHGFST